LRCTYKVSLVAISGFWNSSWATGEAKPETGRPEPPGSATVEVRYPGRTGLRLRFCGSNRVPRTHFAPFSCSHEDS